MDTIRMPRLERDFNNTAFVLFGRGGDGSFEGPIGTGAFVGFPGRTNYGTKQGRHVYAVTNWHVACQGGASIIRINTRSGGSRFLELEPDEWEFCPGGDDLAAADITDQLGEDDEIRIISTLDFLTDVIARSHHLGIGEDGFMLGLFANQPGRDRNIIAARFGNLSLLADAAAPIEQPNGIPRPSHVFDMRSRSGFSGSPVFVYRTPDSDLSNIEHYARRYVTPTKLNVDLRRGRQGISYDAAELQQKYSEARTNTFIKLLGIHAGQHLERFNVRYKANSFAEATNALLDGDKLDVPSSMTIVVPAQAIMGLLDMPKLRELRDRRTAFDERQFQKLKSTAVP